MNEIKLKPCPFCGRSDTLSINEVSQRLDDTDIKQYTVICNTSGDNAGCGANCGYINFTKQDAIAAWNKRNSRQPRIAERRANMTTEQVIEILADIKEYYRAAGFDDRLYYGCGIRPLTDIENKAIDKAIEILEKLKGD